MADSPVLEAVAQYRAALLRSDEQALRRLIDAYRRSYARLGQSVDLLLLEIGDATPSPGQIVRMQRYKSLMAQTAQELQGFTGLTRLEMDKAAELGIRLGERHARELISITATGTPEIAAAFNVLPRSTIEQLLGFLAPDSPLYARLQVLAPQTASLVSDAITSGVALGYNPRKIAGIVRDAFGRGLTDALRFTRTVQLWSYRESSRASYVANSDVVEGWIWHAQLDDRVCMSCVAQHGKEYPLSETLNDHHNGRCAMIPKVKGFDRVTEEGAGEAWFNEQSEATQRKMMGKGKHEAWQEGQFEFSRLSSERRDDVYGLMRTEASLKELVPQGNQQ
jgi:hypothetical protein